MTLVQLKFILSQFTWYSKTQQHHVSNQQKKTQRRQSSLIPTPRVRVDRKRTQGFIWPGGQAPTGSRIGEDKFFFQFSVIFFNFQILKTFLCTFIAKNNTCGQNPGPGGLINPLGAEDVKCTCGWTFSRGVQRFNYPLPHQLTPCQCWTLEQSLDTGPSNTAIADYTYQIPKNNATVQWRL